MKVTWAAEDLRTGRHVASSDADEAMTAASLIKLPIMVAVLHRIEAGRLRLTDNLAITARHRVGGSGWLTEAPQQDADVGTLLRAMIDTSDNAATNVLLDLLGYDAVNVAARAAGMRHTVLARHMMDAAAREAGRENYTSAADVCALLRAVAAGDLLAPASRQVALDALRGQLVPGYLVLPDLAERGLAFAHKTGELDGVRHDAGILLRGADPLAVLAVVGSCEPGDEPELERALAERGRALVADLELG